MELEMCECCYRWVCRHVYFKYALIKEKAQLKAREVDITTFSASYGWACNFARRNDLKMRRRCGERGRVQM